MEEPKTLSYDWQYGREELFLRVDSYMSDDNLYIGLYHMEDGYPESFADLTVNLPFAPLGGINEAYIDHNFSKEKLRFIKQHKLGTIQPDTASSGYCIFQRVAFDLNVNTKSRIIDYDIRELGEQLMPLGMLVTLDSIFNRVIQNWKKGKTTWIFADEFYLLFRYEYSADFFYRLYKRIRKYSGFVTGLTQNVEELLKSDTARLMLANSEFLILLNQATTDRDELAALLNISDNQLSYITNVGAGHGLIRCSGNLVPFENSFPRNTKLYRLMTTKPGEA